MAEPSTTTDANAWWRLWGIAAAMHTVANTTPGWSTSSGVAIVVGLIGAAVALRPHEPIGRVALVVAIPASVWSEAPLLGNHWLVAGLISLVALGAGPWRHDWFDRAGPGIRLCLLGFYSFAAFAKLNSGFLDTTESCARVFANQALELWGMPTIGAGSVGATVAIAATLLIEGSVPFLLVVRRTRRFGVLLAAGFHLFLTIDLVQHFYDFTLVLLPLFLSFTPTGVLTRFDRRWTGPIPHGGRPLAVVLGVLVVGAGVPLGDFGRVVIIGASWVLWLVLGSLLAWGLTALRFEPQRLQWRPQPASLAVLLVVVLIGTAPYLGLRTATSYTMYSNLAVVSGESNHVVIRTGPTLRPAVDDLVVIVATDDEALAEYIDSGLALPWLNLVDYVQRHPAAAVTYERDGTVVVVKSTHDDDELMAARSVWSRKVGALRSVPVGQPAECQPRWLAAH